MAYNNTIPQPGDQPKDSQPQILTNFAAIKTLIDVNHVTFDAAGEGKHKFITLPVQAAAPALATDNGIYNKNYATTAKNETYIHNQTLAGTSDIPMSASFLSNTAVPILGLTGWTYLPSGVLIKWGYATGNGLATIDISVAGEPDFIQMLSVWLTPIAAGAGDVNTAVRFIDILDEKHFTAYFSARTTLGAAAGEAVFLAIGY
jgi:hypothetical protein